MSTSHTVMLVSSPSQVVVTDCQFVSNEAKAYGGGMALWKNSKASQL
jgi:hypothetical protein